jgi:hypothetical protein
MMMSLLPLLSNCCCVVGAVQVDDDAPADEIKKAYRSLAKECHPDYLGDEGHNICILLNEAYEVCRADMCRRPARTRALKGAGLLGCAGLYRSCAACICKPTTFS